VTFDEKEIDRPGIVHRLDKETSGVLIIVKTKRAFAYFKKQFMDREIKKNLLAIVSGWVKNDHGTINNQSAEVREISVAIWLVAGREEKCAKQSLNISF